MSRFLPFFPARITPPKCDSVSAIWLYATPSIEAARQLDSTNETLRHRRLISRIIDHYLFWLAVSTIGRSRTFLKLLLIPREKKLGRRSNSRSFFRFEVWGLYSPKFKDTKLYSCAFPKPPGIPARFIFAMSEPSPLNRAWFNELDRTKDQPFPIYAEKCLSPLQEVFPLHGGRFRWGCPACSTLIECYFLF